MFTKPTTIAVIMITLATAIPMASAQAPPGAAIGLTPAVFSPAVEPGPDNHHSSTVIEGFHTGLARAIRATGQANYNTAAAMNIAQDTYAKYLRNRRDFVTNFFDLRELNRERRLLERRGPSTPEQIDRFNRNRLPDRLTEAHLDPDTGEIAWPEALQYGWFDQGRRKMEPLFVHWAAGRGRSGTSVHREIRKLAKEMGSRLRENAKKMDPLEVIAARKFIEGLKYEAQLSPIHEQQFQVSQNRAGRRDTIPF